MTRVAALDCGTNTVRLLVADLDASTGRARELTRQMQVVRLGEGVDRTGRLSEEALARTFRAVDAYAAVVTSYGVEAVRFCATSAARDASNAARFTAGIRARIGVQPEVLTGAEEARLGYDGATRGLDEPGPLLVLDIGGGSTELVIGSRHGAYDAAWSLDVGAVRLTERLMPSDPPTAAEVAAATAVVDAALETLPGHGVDLGSARTVVGVAGTVTTLAALVLELPAYDRAAVHGSRLDVAAVRAQAARLLAMTTDERRRLPSMHPGRADVIAAGALVLDRALGRASATSLLVSEADILDGIAWSLG